MRDYPYYPASLSPRPSGLGARLRAYLKLIRADRPIGILLLLWPALWGLWIAGEGFPPWQVMLIFVLGVALMRSAGCAINDFADRHIDGRVARTDQRPLVTGAIRPWEALAVFAVLSLLAFGLVLFLNAQTIRLSFVAVVLAAAYPFMKRFTHMPQLVLGMAFGMAVPMAFTALQGQVPLVGWVLFAATVVWALIYDTEYAMVDREDDLKIGVKSTAILFGRYDRLAIALLQLLMLLLLAWVGVLSARGWAYYVGLAVASLFFVRQQWLIRGREPRDCFAAFTSNNCFGMSVYFGLLVDYLLQRLA